PADKYRSAMSCLSGWRASCESGAVDSVPVVDLQIARCRPAFPRHDIVAQAQQECRPFHAAVRHELDGLTPVAMAEEHDRLPVLLREPARDVRTDPLGWSVDATPAHVGIRVGLLHLHYHLPIHRAVVVAE